MAAKRTWNRKPRWTESQLFFAALIVPLFAYDMTLQAVRLSAHLPELIDFGTVGWFTGIALAGSALAFNLGFGLFAAVLLLVREQGGRLWLAVAAALQLLALLFGAVDTVAWVYFAQTLDALDWTLLWRMVSQPSDLALLLAGEVTLTQWLLLVLVFALEVTGPWAARRWARDAINPYAGYEKRSLLWARVAAVSGIPVIALGLLPPLARVRDLALVRSPALHLLATALHPSGPSAEVDLAAQEPPFFEPGNLAIERLPGTPRRNLVIIVLESIRARATTPYEPRLQTTPFLASLAGKSLVVDPAYVVMPSTAKALTAILCSIYPSISLEPRALTLGLLNRCLPRLLREQGYQTLYMQTAGERYENRLAAVANMGFETFIKPDEMRHQGLQQPNFLGYEDDAMLPPSAAWLRAHRMGPIFAVYLTLNAHHDYNRLTRHGVHHFAPEDDALDRYLNNVRHDDEFLAALFDQYKELGLYQNTLFVIVADHGEAFGEHGRRAHNAVPYEEALHVPLLVHDPSGTLFSPGLVKGPASQLDIMPTALSLLGFKVKQGRMNGISLFELPRDRVLMMSCYGMCAIRLTAAEAFIHHFGRRPDELFDLRRDPRERHDLGPGNPHVMEERRNELLVFLRRVNSFFFLHKLHLARPRP